MATYELQTTRRAVRMQAESAEQATLIFTGRALPPGIDRYPGPMIPMDETPPPEWHAWRVKLEEARTRIFFGTPARLAWEHGECLTRVEEVGQA